VITKPLIARIRATRDHRPHHAVPRTAWRPGCHARDADLEHRLRDPLARHPAL